MHAACRSATTYEGTHFPSGVMLFSIVRHRQVDGYQQLAALLAGEAPRVCPLCIYNYVKVSFKIWFYLGAGGGWLPAAGGAASGRGAVGPSHCVCMTTQYQHISYHYLRRRWRDTSGWRRCWRGRRRGGCCRPRPAATCPSASASSQVRCSRNELVAEKKASYDCIQGTSISPSAACLLAWLPVCVASNKPIMTTNRSLSSRRATSACLVLLQRARA